MSVYACLSFQGQWFAFLFDAPVSGAIAPPLNDPPPPVDPAFSGDGCCPVLFSCSSRSRRMRSRRRAMRCCISKLLVNGSGVDVDGFSCSRCRRVNELRLVHDAAHIVAAAFWRRRYHPCRSFDEHHIAAPDHFSRGGTGHAVRLASVLYPQSFPSRGLSPSSSWCVVRCARMRELR